MLFCRDLNCLWALSANNPEANSQEALAPFLADGSIKKCPNPQVRAINIIVYGVRNHARKRNVVCRLCSVQRVWRKMEAATMSNVVLVVQSCVGNQICKQAGGLACVVEAMDATIEIMQYLGDEHALYSTMHLWNAIGCIYQ